MVSLLIVRKVLDVEGEERREEGRRQEDDRHDREDHQYSALSCYVGCLHRERIVLLEIEKISYGVIHSTGLRVHPVNVL